MLSERSPERILLTTSTFPMEQTERVTARFVLDLAQHLTAHAKVFVLAPAGPRTSQREMWGDVTVIRFPYFAPARLQRLAAGEGMVATMRASTLARIQAPFFVASQWAMLPRVVRQERIDLINAHWIVPQGVIAATWRRRLHVPLVITSHGADVAWLNRTRSGDRIGRFVFDRADGFIAVSKYLATRTEEIVGRVLPHETIPMGVSLAHFQPRGRPPEPERPDGARTLLFVGKLIPKKGVNVLIDAVHRLRVAEQRVHLTIIGGGPLEAEIRSQIARLGLEQQVELRGWVRNEELPSYYAAADVVCIPSVKDAHGETEGTPVVLLEAMASGAVVVASRISGIPDVIDDRVNGWTVPPDDAEALARAIVTALGASDDARATLRTAARRTAEGHSWERVAERFMAAFRLSAARYRTR